jgi:hypothetical protein
VKNPIAFTLCAAALALLSGAANADTATIVADRDNTLFEMQGLPDLSSARGDLFTGGIAQQNEFGNAYRRRALLHFDFASIPAGATITSATLTMRMTKTISGAYQFNIYRMLGDWGEGTSNSGTLGTGAPATPGDVTWNYRFFGDPSSAWVNRGGDFDSTIVTSAMINQVGSYSWTGGTMASAIQSWVNGTTPNFGWMIAADIEALTGTAKRFASRENSTPSFRPTLVVNYVIPAPAGIAAFAGLCVLGARRRRA